jgi:ADP-L-glycero-D-manno-heptose 6-epimerase
MADKTVHVVTGGAGFIGSNIVAGLEEQGADVVVIDTFGLDEKWRNIAKRRLEDIVEPSQTIMALGALAPKIASVIHMGAISSTAEMDIARIIESNFRYSCLLWHWCAAQDVPFIYASSAATYGDGSNGFHDHTEPDYLAQLKPLNAYGWSKHLFDRWVCHRVANKYPAPSRWAGLKFFNVYGPNEYHKGPMRSVAVQLFEQVQRGEAAKLFASDRPDCCDGGQKRDFVWVGNCVDIALWFVHGTRPNGIYNVGSGQARTFSDLADAVFVAMGKSPRIEFVPMPEDLKGRYQYFTEATTKKLSIAGYVPPRTPLEEGIRNYVSKFLVAGDIYR